MPDLPYPDLRPGDGHPDGLGLVHRRTGDETAHQAECHLSQDDGDADLEKECRTGLCLVQWPSRRLPAGGENRSESPDPLAYPLGDVKDPQAKIHPFKIHTGKQIYDTQNNIFITPHLYGADGFWKTFDWVSAAKIGMDSTGLPYSGEFGFAPTQMYWRIDHQVAPKNQALGCLDCHGDNGRMDWKGLGYKGDPMTNPAWARKI